MRLVERDFIVLREIDRWRFMLGRHIAILCGFSSYRTADRRLKILIEAGYINRKKILYGMPNIYTLTYKGRMIISSHKHAEMVRIDQLRHDVAVLDVLIYIMKSYGLSNQDIISAKELHKQDGFGSRQHQPDFVFIKDNKSYAAEVELSLKKIERLEANLKSNFHMYDTQVWIIEKNSSVERIINEYLDTYPNIKILYIEKIYLGDVK